jgi:hypothetical protein
MDVVQSYVRPVIVNGSLARVQAEEMGVVRQAFGQRRYLLDCLGSRCYAACAQPLASISPSSLIDMRGISTG